MTTNINGTDIKKEHLLQNRQQQSAITTLYPRAVAPADPPPLFPPNPPRRLSIISLSILAPPLLPSNDIMTRGFIPPPPAPLLPSRDIIIMFCAMFSENCACTSVKQIEKKFFTTLQEYIHIYISECCELKI